MGSLDGKTAIVTGANRGIGAAIARKLASEGAGVVLAARDQSKLDAVVSEIQAAGGEAIAYALDLRDPSAPGALTEFAENQWGRIDVVINNAGATKRGGFLELAEEDWADGFALKFYATVRLSRAAWPYLKAQKGSVLNIVGVGGRTPGLEFAIGGSVNAALLSFTKTLAELGIRDSVQVNAVNPGPVHTDRFDKMLAAQAASEQSDIETVRREFVQKANITRVGEPEDIANLVAFIVSPSGRLLQGSLIDIDGGQTKTL